MALFSTSPPSDALDRLLTHERQMILAGNVGDLAKIGSEKERLLARLPASGLDARALDRLRVKATRNQELLGAAARGLKSVRERLEAIQAQQANLRTYASNGSPAALNRTAPGFNKRA